VQAERADLQARLEAAPAASDPADPSEETADLREKLAAAEARILELEGARDEAKLLTEQLAAAEERLAAATEGGEDRAATDEIIASLRSEVNTVSDRLFALRSELAARDQRIETLEQQLDQTTAELVEMRLSAPTSAEAQQAMVENEVLRGILLRELREQARRQQAKRLIEEEIAALEIQSESLAENLGLLGRGIELTEEERLLFRLPVAQIEESGTDSFEVSIAITKPPEDQSGAEPGTSPVEPQGLADLPPAAQEQTEKAQREFAAGRTTEAEDLLLDLAREHPTNYFLLAQLAAVQFQTGKTRAAEVVLNRALELNPDDPFSLSILGVVRFRQGRLEEAEKVLRRSLELDPDRARTHNYLGIVLSQTGQMEEAEKQMHRAIELDPTFAEAHFNLAVIYATQDPPMLDLARRHYFSATSLGAQPDIAMERLLQ
jgi:Flp pilus assembly protein TadD/predicted  nucleic acid-binding Zn-ribbon protein